MNELQHPNPPQAIKRESITSIHGKKLIDYYAWMRLSDAEKEEGIQNPHTKEVVEYLEEENSYTSRVMAHLEDFQTELFEEIKGRFVPSDVSVPYFNNGYFYLRKFNDGQEYPLYTRKKETLENEEEMLIDVNQLAEGYSYYNVGGLKVSPNNKVLAFSEDSVSRRQYKIRFKDLIEGSFLEDEIENTTGSMVWSNNNKVIYYTRRDETLRPSRIFKHILGTLGSQDKEIYFEKDDAFYATIYKTNSGKYLVISLWSTVSQEYRILKADDPHGAFKIFQPRERNLEYYIDHHDDFWYIHTNVDQAYNFQVMKTSETKLQKENWLPLIAHRQDTLIEKIECFNKCFIVSKRFRGNNQIEVIPWNRPENAHHIDFPETSFMAYTSSNYHYETDFLRVTYTSLITPVSTYDYHWSTKELVLQKRELVLGDFDPVNYKTERLYAKANDGEEIPISLIYPVGFLEKKEKPLLLYGYGSYGNSMDPYFSAARLSLLDRGMAFAIAHIRGGEEKGRKWYENGKLLKKKNTFYDFIDCGKYLIETGYCSDNQLFGMGGSAGGLLVGAVINMAPTLWKGIIAAVPFVDVINTMLDETIPLTTGEFDEWGNPKDKTYFDYILDYSPYDNVEKKDYPSILVTTGYHDSQVQYWEPAKWVAKLREQKTDDNILLLHTNMETGHGGLSGRFRRYKETAMDYSFLLDLAGLIR